ncbi:MAG: hypothetical protein HY658_02310, partial [Actinobacteria bacterium]|nr:hypothetical protein [Actinomycetota bacterium]
MARRTALVPALLLALSPLLAAPAGATEPGTSSNFELVGHDPLFSRGMNAAPAIFEHHVYVGNRTDGSPHHPHPGVLVVDVADPTNPEVVGEIGPPDQGIPGETSRELRVWPDEGLLLVLNFGCSALIHACVSGADLVGTLVPTIKFYDVAADPVDPPLVATYVPSRVPHEFFLWADPVRPGRALLYMSTPTSRTDRPNLIVADISGAREGVFDEVLAWNGNDLFTAGEREGRDVRLHSMGVSADGSRVFLAYLGGGFLVLDSTELAAGTPGPQVRLLTDPGDSPRWPNQTVHSAVNLPGRPFAITTDEVYGDLLDPLVRPENEFGCPWGWVHVIDVADEALPRLVGELRVEENEDAYCETAEGSDPANTTFTSYAAHNPTVLGQLALVTWHSAGIQAIDLRDPRRPRPAGHFSPEPLPFVFTEDPALSLGVNKVVMWSFPIVRDGLIY